MSEFDPRNRGVLFKGKKAQTNHADYEGSLNVEGVDYWLNAWIKEGKSGKFMSVSIRKKQAPAKPLEPQTREASMKAVLDLDSDTPF